MSVPEMKNIMLEILCSVVDAMANRMQTAENEKRNPFITRTNIYRAEDGRPICYCCLKVGHVAKYCWDRMYSRPHNQVQDVPPPASPFNGTIDIESLGRDVEKLLKELQGVIRAVELSNTTPFRADDLQMQTDLNGKYPHCPPMEKPNVPEMKKEPTGARCEERWPREHFYPYSERPNQAQQTTQRLIHGVT